MVMMIFIIIIIIYCKTVHVHDNTGGVLYSVSSVNKHADVRDEGYFCLRRRFQDL